MRRPLIALALCLPITAVALTLAAASLAVGPSLPALDSGTAINSTHSADSYVARLEGASTRLQARRNGRTVRTLTLQGGWGIQLVTIGGTLSGLSPNGRVLILSDNVHPDGSLRARSRFAVIDTPKLTLRRRISLHGDYSVDALSPNGNLLYLIHHVSHADATKYQVQAYNLQTKRLLPGVIADKRQAGWIMAGYPIARATTNNGSWVYTLYRQDNNYPFIHALDTIHHTAVCIGLPANWTTDNGWISSARLKLDADTLTINTQNGKTRFLLNTKTFQVTTP